MALHLVTASSVDLRKTCYNLHSYTVTNVIALPHEFRRKVIENYAQFSLKLREII